MKKTSLLLLITSNAVFLRRDKSYISHLASRRIQFTSSSVCLKTFKSSENIIANIVPNTDKTLVWTTQYLIASLIQIAN